MRPRCAQGPESREVCASNEIVCANDAGRASRKYPAVVKTGPVVAR